MASEENKPLQTVDPAKLQQMKQQTEGKYRMTMEAFKRNTGHEHPLAGKLEDGDSGDGKGHAFRKPEGKDNDAKE